MASSTGFDTGVRSALNAKGVTNDRISYNPTSGVMVDNKTFIKPDKVYQGTSFTNQNNFNNAWSSYNKPANSGSAATSTVGTGATAPYTPSNTTPYNPYTQTHTQNPYTSQTDSVIQQLLDYGKNQPSFDPYSSSGYKAAEAQAQRSAQASTRSAQESYGSAGFGRSTGLGERVAGINNDANEYLMTQIVPQLEAQESARRQQEYNNMLSSLSPLMSQQGRSDSLVQQDFNNGLSVADRTGYYMPRGADQIISQLLALKGQAETSGITATDRNTLSSQADQLRAQLQAMGLDASALGANVNRANASTANIGTRTLTGQAQDYSQQADARDYTEGVRQYDTNLAYQKDRDTTSDSQWDKTFEYTQGRDKVADQQWQDEFDRIKEQDGINSALAWANQNLNQDKFQSDVDQDLYKLQTEQAAGDGPTAADISQNISKSISALGKDVDITSDAVKKQIEGIIVTQTQDPLVAVQLHKMYNIPIPSDLQALYDQSLKQ